MSAAAAAATTALASLMNKLDDLKEHMSEGEYLEMMNQMKTVYQSIPQAPATIMGGAGGPAPPAPMAGIVVPEGYIQYRQQLRYSIEERLNNIYNVKYLLACLLKQDTTPDLAFPGYIFHRARQTLIDVKNPGNHQYNLYNMSQTRLFTPYDIQRKNARRRTPPPEYHELSLSFKTGFTNEDHYLSNIKTPLIRLGAMSLLDERSLVFCYLYCLFANGHWMKQEGHTADNVKSDMWFFTRALQQATYCLSNANTLQHIHLTDYVVPQSQSPAYTQVESGIGSLSSSARKYVGCCGCIAITYTDIKGADRAK